MSQHSSTIFSLHSSGKVMKVYRLQNLGTIGLRMRRQHCRQFRGYQNHRFWPTGATSLSSSTASGWIFMQYFDLSFHLSPKIRLWLYIFGRFLPIKKPPQKTPPSKAGRDRTYEPQKETSYFPLYGLFNRDPYSAWETVLTFFLVNYG